jgi:DNA repair protein RecO (recombination protein O)
MLITVNGLVTRSYPSGDHDRLIHIITEDRGRLSVMVKGGSSKRGGATAACTQLFTYGNFELYSGNNGDLYWLRGGSVLTSFYRLSSDITRVALAAYLCDVACDLTDKNAVEEETAPLLRMLLNSLYTLDKGNKSPALVKGVFELRAAAMMGYQPNLLGCDVCGEGYPEAAYFDIMNGCLICADCQSKRNRLAGRLTEITEELGERRIICPLSSSVLAAIRYALAAPDAKIFSFSLLDREAEDAFERVAETYLLNHLERDFETLRFYRTVAESL